MKNNNKMKISVRIPAYNEENNVHIVKKFTVSIGIPAYNEEDNIPHLLNALREQEEECMTIKEILVYTDGSTDNTVALIKSLKDPKVRLKIGKVRKGQQVRQNQMLKDYSGDVLIILEADILPVNRYTINEMVKPFVEKRVNNLGMVIGMFEVLKPEGFFEKILAYGYGMKFKIFAEWKNGKNVYACGGHSMKALSRKFTKKLRWPKNVPEDAYVYLYLNKLGFNLYRQNNAKAYIRNVTNIRDRIKQVKKFVSGKRALLKYFSEDIIRSEYNLPIAILIKNIFLEFLRNPIWISLYLAEVVLNRFLTLNSKNFNDLYLPYNSTRKLKKETSKL